MIQRRFFFDTIRQHLFGGTLMQGQTDGMNAILDRWEADYGNEDRRWLAYALATAHHETDRTFRGIEEYGKGRGRAYGATDPETGHAYFGRGFVQLTWRTNYETMGKFLGVDLVHRPELALEIGTAAKILLSGMTRGMFTGKKLADYFNAHNEDWMQARRIVNGLDRAQLIAGYGRAYFAAVSHTV